MKIFKDNYGLLVLLMGMVLVFGVIAACTRYPNPQPVFEDYEKGVDTQMVRKVLLISMDGAVGSEVEKIMPPTIKNLLPHSVYSWDGLSDPNTSDAATWASIITGVNASKHLIGDSSFLPVTSSDQIPPYYPGLFYYIKENNPADQSVSITSWRAMNDNLFIHANTRITPFSDEGVKDSALAYLREDNAAFFLVDFRSLLNVGKENAFSADNDAYKNAVLKLDGYIGQILDTVRARKHYESEDWLIIITSNHGGVLNDYGGNSLQERNILTLFYNPSIKPQELHRNVLYTTRFHGSDNDPNAVRAMVNDSDGVYNPGNRAFTIEAKIKINKNEDGNYDYGWPSFLSKGDVWESGWRFFRNGSGIGLGIGDDNGYSELKSSGGIFEDGKWHSLAATISYSGQKRMVKLYLDGSLEKSMEMSSTDAIINNEPIVMGYWGGYQDDININICDVRMWDMALSDAAIFQHACQLTVPDNDPDRSHLIGYWPAQEDHGDTIVNKIEDQPDFIIAGPYKYVLDDNTLPCSNSEGAALVQNVSIVPAILYWLDIPEQASWQLDGNLVL